jgi:FHS family L-fucose permease-like MFS transporter
LTAQIAGRSSATAPADVAHLRLFVFTLFFIFGGITSLNDVIIPKLKGLFTLSYGEVMLVQSAFFTAYFVISLPAAAIVRRLGYMRTAVIGLLMMTAGCLLFVPASSSGLFVTFLAALFVLAAGITIVQVVANPLISMLGAPATAHSRLTFAQAFNSLGTTMFPYVGSILILGSLAESGSVASHGRGAGRVSTQATHVIVRTYLGLAAALVLVAALVWLQRNRLVETALEDVTFRHALDLLRQPRFGFGAACIFLYVGAEVAIGSLHRQLSDAKQCARDRRGGSRQAVPFYWGGAMVGRFIGAYLLRRFSPGKVLACAAAAAISLLALSANSAGALSGVSLLAVGLFNPSCSPRSSPWPARAWVRGPPRARGSSASPSSAARSFR